MVELLLVFSLIIILFAAIRFWNFSNLTNNREKQWEEEHFNKQIEALKKVSQKDGRPQKENR